MNITIELLAIPKTHILSDAAKEARRYRRGDIVEAFLRSEIIEPPSPNSPFIFIHINNVPDTRTFEQVKKKIMQPVYEPVIIVDPEEYRRRKFRIRLGQLPQAVIDELTATREYEVSWTQAKNFIRRKAVIDRYNPAGDDESNFITDADLD